MLQLLFLFLFVGAALGSVGGVLSGGSGALLSGGGSGMVFAAFAWFFSGVALRMRNDHRLDRFFTDGDSG